MTDALQALVVAPVPPPIEGGIARGIGIMREHLATCPDVQLRFVDTAVRWRRQLNLSIGVRLIGGTLQALRDTYRVYRVLKTNPPTVVHLHTSGSLATPRDVLMLLIARWFGVPRVLHYHVGTLPETVAHRGLLWNLTRRAVSLASLVVVLDERSETSLKQAIPGARVVQLPNMIEIDVADAEAHDGPVSPAVPAGAARIVFVGHVLPTKGVQELVEACLRLESPPWVLEVVGGADRSFQDRLRAVAATGEVNRVRFHGHLDHAQVLRLIRASDLFVLPSYTEGAPNVVLEAMACGRTILATTVGAIPEMLDAHGLEPCGVCVPPRDVEALLGAMTDLLRDPGRRAELGRRARRRVEEQYSVPAVCRRVISMWESLTAESRAVGG